MLTTHLTAVLHMLCCAVVSTGCIDCCSYPVTVHQLSMVLLMQHCEPAGDRVCLAASTTISGVASISAQGENDYAAQTALLRLYNAKGACLIM